VIKVNLLPGSRGGTKRRFAFSMPARQKKGGGGGGAGNRMDPWALAAGVVLLGVLGAAGWLFTGTSGRSGDLQVQIEGAARDSVRYSELIAQATALQARRDTLAQRVALIQEIDGARYVWPHIMDEVARALPEFTWMTQMVQITPGLEPRFRIEGRAGNTFALTRFLTSLGDSPFFSEVLLVSANQISETGAGGRAEEVQQFTIEAAYRTPPPELLQLVPLFESSAAMDDALMGGR
jgi:Tfp pilus assembly protein PilN